MFTTGVPRNEHSLMPADELPTRQAACASSATKSFAGTLVMNRMCAVSSGCCSRMWRRLSAISPVPASGFGQNQIVGSSNDATTFSVVSRCARLSRLGRHRMLHDHQERLLDVDVVADAEGVDLLAGDRRADVRGQLDVERAGVEDVRGSSPIASTRRCASSLVTKWRCASLVMA